MRKKADPVFWRVPALLPGALQCFHVQPASPQIRVCLLPHKQACFHVAALLVHAGTLWMGPCLQLVILTDEPWRHACGSEEPKRRQLPYIAVCTQPGTERATILLSCTDKLKYLGYHTMEVRNACW